VKGFLEKSGVFKNKRVFTEISRYLRKISKKMPFLGLTLGLLLQGEYVHLRRGLLISLAACIPKMPVSLTLLIYRKYLSEVMEEPGVRRKRRNMGDKYALRYMEDGMTKKILHRCDGRMGWLLVGKAKSYYINSHPQTVKCLSIPPSLS
jgi:hypothetical protein